MAGTIALTILDEVKSIVNQFSPLIGRLLSSSMLTTGLNILCNAFSIKNNDYEALLESLKNPEAANKLREIEFKHSEILRQIQATNYQTEVSDRISARNRQISLHDYVPTILAIGFLINYALIQFYCVTHLNASNDIISARFQDVLIMIISYYFGSSHKHINQVTHEGKHP